MLKVEGLNISFGGVRAVRDVSFEIVPGELVSLIGPNGAGKTTVFNCINGIYRPDEGSVLFEGREVVGFKPDRVSRLGIARTFQNIELFSNMTALQNLLLGRHSKMKYGLLRAAFFGPRVMKEEISHRRRVEEIMDILDLQFARDQLVGSLPYGVQKMVELGRALASEPKLLLLDEPFAGMNAEEKQDLVFRIGDIRAEFGVSILLVEHDMRTVMSLSDRVIAINEGALIASGDPAEVASHPEVLRAYLGVETPGPVETEQISSEAPADA